MLERLDQILVPTLQPGDIVMADNLAGPTRSPADGPGPRPERSARPRLTSRPRGLPGPPGRTSCVWTKLVRSHPTARTSIPSSSMLREPAHGPSFAPLAVWYAAPRRSGRSSASGLAHFSPDECRTYVRHCGYAAATRS